MFTRDLDGWRLSEAGAGERLRLASVDVVVEVDVVYQGVAGVG